MYLEPWMLVVLVLSFGVCAWYNRKAGMMTGFFGALDALEEQKIIQIVNDEILPNKFYKAEKKV
jgi:hypothetical protein